MTLHRRMRLVFWSLILAYSVIFLTLYVLLKVPNNLRVVPFEMEKTVRPYAREIARSDVKICRRGVKDSSRMARYEEAYEAWRDGLPRRNATFNCSPKNHILFRKVHKCGSTTLANIFLRYAFLNNLRVVPFSFNLAPNQKYDILAHHCGFNETRFQKALPKDVFKMGLVREPFSKFKSAFFFYQRRLESTLPFSSDNHLKEFLINYDKWSQSLKLPVGIRRNSMSQEMGTYHEGLRRNRTDLKAFLNNLSNYYDFVAIQDRTDESLVLLRRRLCWDLRDIVYRRKLTGKYNAESFVDSELITRHKTSDSVDFALYNYFNNKLMKEIAQQNNDFYVELQYFKQLNGQITEFCEQPRTIRSNSVLEVERSPWSAGFTVDDCFCSLMTDIMEFKRWKN
ncbi:galactosylceramide sulfotransferase [Lingula anatina]|uniref:Galactosylceramide sulfotransferase n=1 Tax=Lingula anatina TaxID=7574 RepID=A0A1S3IHU8_LINAN|nr:galactosylceramide sulfotransferase [Lingula anatina]|eukprot:XP_013397064.2 galactosylceramide sulfotransferase [Lingula anatina]